MGTTTPGRVSPTNFIDSFKIELSAFHLARIAKIDQFDYTCVIKKVNRDLGGVTATYLLNGADNLKRYYIVALLDPRNRHAVSKSVDPFWHSHVLFTRQYKDFCHDVFDGEFIHHVPLDPEDAKMVKHVQELYDYTLEVYKGIFKKVDGDWWPSSSVAGFQTVCLHEEVHGDEIVKNGLFSERPELRAD